MKIVVLTGGTSTERDVSLITGKMVAHSLAEKGHEICFMDVFFGIEDISDIDSLFSTTPNLDVKGIGEKEPDIEEIKKIRGGNKDCFFGKNVIEVCRAADIVFMALHGENGENGKLQAALDLFGIRYTGSGSLGSSLAMNKYLTKQIFIENNIKTASYKLVKNVEEIPEMPIPCVVKTTSGGSSIGVYIVRDKKDYKPSVEKALKFDGEVIVEEFIKGRELTVGVLDGKCLPPVEIIPKTGFYDYKNKYQAGLTDEICPANLTVKELETVNKAALAAHKALSLSVYSRADFILTEDGEAYCLEVNTLPGMTPTSLVPREAKTIGMTYSELCEKIIECSLNK